MMAKKDPLNYEDVQKKVKDFDELINSIENIESKKKQLWKEIYENAFIDRMNAYMLFTDCFTGLSGSTADHVQVGGQLAKYIERMNKANDQLIKLAEMISKEEERANSVSSDDLFKEIGG
ncbi:MAG TPA: hypothetical protein DD671_12625 [Balneolaceae bacterium]|nr:hypothetical protein [Balneolaceae bacterium]|tara:strand:- start:57 stop:416 length:360 start_codon:yes stop_codon:yes gene_type:complete